MNAAQAASSPARRTAASEISSQERQEILVRIDELVAGARRPPEPTDRALRGAPRGALFPLAVNLGAVVLIAAGLYFLPRIFDASERRIVAHATVQPAGEARIVSAVVQEGEAKLAAKDREIVGIQSRIDDLGRELARLRTGRDAEIARREEALRKGLAAEIAAERQRLEKAGASAAALEKQLAALDQRRSSELAQQLAAYRRQKDAEIAAKEREIDAQFGAFQRDLAAAREARTQLEADLAKSQASGAQAVSEQQRLARELAARTEQSRREEFALGQLTAAWQSVDDAMKAGLWDNALRGLDGITALLGQDGIAALPAVQRRAAVDGFLVQSMRRLIAADRGDPAAGGIAAAAQAASSLVVQAEAKLSDGDRKAARELYLEAIGKLPALQTAYARLSAMDAGGTASSRQAVADAVAQADAAYAAGNWKTAIDRYEKALGLLRDVARDLPRAASRIADAGYRQTSADLAARQDRSARTLIDKADSLLQRGDLNGALVAYASVVDSYPLSAQVKNAVAGITTVVDARIRQKQDEIARLEQSLAGARSAEAAAAAAAQEKARNLTDSLAAAARRGSQAADAARKELVTLLQAKVLVKEALNADAVKAAHPGLAESLDRYIELYGEQKRGEGSAAALADVAAVSDYLLGKKTANDLSGIWTRYADEVQRSALQQVLDRLKALAP